MLARWQKTIVDERGNIIPGAVLKIRRESDQAIVNVYRDRNGTQPYPSGAVAADENGYAFFYVSDGLYRITSVKPVIDWRDVTIGSTQNITMAPVQYETEADMRADVGQDEGTVALVWGDDSSSNGYYGWDGSGWIRTAYQPATADQIADRLIYATNKSALPDIGVDGATAWVIDDPDDTNNGLWRWSADIEDWERAPESAQPLNAEQINQAVRDVQSLLERRLPYGDGSDTHAFVDAEEKLLVRIDKDAKLHLVGLDGAIQDVVRREGGSADIAFLSDRQGNIVFRVDKDANVFVPGLEGRSIQDAINDGGSQGSVPTTTYGSLRRPRDLFAPEVQAMFSARSGSQPAAPAPLNSLPQAYDVGTGWINLLTTDQPAPTPINTTYRDNDGVVHPYLCEFYNGFRGYRYILGITGYYNTNESEENPFVFGSHDLQTFELLGGFEQPLADRPDVPNGHNSDIFFTYDPRSGELICCWRQSIRNAGPDGQTMDSLWCRKTLNGYTWSDAQNIFPETPRGQDIILSPSILFDPTIGNWHMYDVKTNRIQHRTAPSLHGPWGDPDIIAHPAEVSPWHLDVRWCGNRQVMLIHDDGRGAGPDNLYFGVSEGDFITWSIGTTPVIQNVTLGVYKSTFVPVFNDDGQMAMDIVWTGDSQPSSAAQKWRLFVNRTNFVTV